MGKRQTESERVASQVAEGNKRALHPTVPAYETDHDRNAREAHRTGVHPGFTHERGNDNKERP